MENDYQTELEERMRQKQFARQQALELAKSKGSGRFKGKELKNKFIKKRGASKLKQTKKRVRIWLALGQIVLSWGLSPAGWAMLFKESLLLGVLCLAAYLFIIIAIVVLIVSIIMMSICQAVGSFAVALVSLVSDKLDFCKAF